MDHKCWQYFKHLKIVQVEKCVSFLHVNEWYDKILGQVSDIDIIFNSDYAMRKRALVTSNITFLFNQIFTNKPC